MSHLNQDKDETVEGIKEIIQKLQFFISQIEGPNTAVKPKLSILLIEPDASEPFKDDIYEVGNVCPLDLLEIYVDFVKQYTKEAYLHAQKCHPDMAVIFDSLKHIMNINIVDTDTNNIKD